MKKKIFLIVVIVVVIQQLKAQEDTLLLTASKIKLINFIGNQPIKVGDYNKKGVKFRLAIIDGDENSRFNDEGPDFLFIGNYGADTIFAVSDYNSCEQKKLNFIKFNNAIFKIAFIDPAGEYVIIDNVKELPVENINTSVISLIDQLPDDSFKLLNGKEDNFSNYLNQNKLIYVDFWETWCHGCTHHVLPEPNDIKELMDINKYFSKQITIICMNSGDSITAELKLIQKYKLNWTQGVATLNIQRKFGSYAKCNMLFDSKGNIIKMNITPYELLNYLNSSGNIKN